ncbi:MAG: YqaE/Pmp3 family membrane protein [Chloroflexota bacterium]|nr:YqaE/Pmp3 family membrane protein [Chloroflexota bacterium]
MSCLRLGLSVLLPPLGAARVFLTVGLGLHFWLNILLTVLGYIPGLVHAVWIIARNSGRSRAIR